MRIPFLFAAAAAGSALYLITRKPFEPIPDDTLVIRARGALEKIVEHAGSIDIQARNGVITLHGPIGKDELRSALRAIRALPGVREVAAALTPHS
jgi:hypothetical protein